jgi:hypothetical protein
VINMKVISGFPGVGKTYFKEHYPGSVADSDSSLFSWVSPGIRNLDFPQNYMNHIVTNINDIVLVSSHKVVRDALVLNGIYFTLVYPERDLKQEYLERFRVRGSNEDFITLLDTMWDEWIDQLNMQWYCHKIVLQAGETLFSI